MQTIAEHLGVSKYAVSRSLAGKGGVSETTRRTVERMARELGYVAPGVAASARTIHLVLHDHDPVNSEVQLRIQRGIQREAERHGYQVQMQWTHDLRRIHELGRSGAGMILVGPHAPVVTQPAQRALPLVKVGLIGPLEPIDQVDVGANEATAAFGLKLYDYGHRDIVFLQGNGRLRGRTGRFRALRDALTDVGCTAVTELFFDENGGFLAAFEALRATGRQPTALVAGNDWIAVSVISDLMRAGLRVPHDVSVIGYGDYAAAVQTTPQLTTIRVPGEEMGAAALQLLLERLERRADPQRAPRRILISPTLVERQSLRRL
ncbi:MAG: LacI family DNA-binding transcriptional regulator [Devosia sp.]|nr:LacI family DNA-binding transcriptional regulator [Devosia sp.]